MCGGRRHHCLLRNKDELKAPLLHQQAELFQHKQTSEDGRSGRSGMPGLVGTVTFIELCTASSSPGSLHFLLRTITPLTLLGGPPPVWLLLDYAWGGGWAARHNRKAGAINLPERRDRANGLSVNADFNQITQILSFQLKSVM